MDTVTVPLDQLRPPGACCETSETVAESVVTEPPESAYVKEVEVADATLNAPLKKAWLAPVMETQSPTE